MVTEEKPNLETLLQAASVVTERKPNLETLLQAANAKWPRLKALCLDTWLGLGEKDQVDEHRVFLIVQLSQHSLLVQEFDQLVLATTCLWSACGLCVRVSARVPSRLAREFVSSASCRCLVCVCVCPSRLFARKSNVQSLFRESIR